MRMLESHSLPHRPALNGEGMSGPRALSRSPSAMVAAFACSETERLGRLFGMPLAVIAATADPIRHARRLSLTWHAGWTACEGWFQPFDYGLAHSLDLAYAHRPFDVRWLGRTALPSNVSLEGGCLKVALPPGCSLRDFGALFGLAMTDRQFDRVSRRPESVRRRFSTGRPLEVVPRYSLMTPGDFGRVTLVEDLYVFRPRDLPAVAAAVAMAANGLALRRLLVPRVIEGEGADV